VQSTSDQFHYRQNTEKKGRGKDLEVVLGRLQRMTILCVYLLQNKKKTRSEGTKYTEVLSVDVWVNR